MILSLGLLVYLALAIWLIECIPERSFWRWVLYIGLSVIWIWPALRLVRWTLRDPGTKIKHLQ